MSLINVYGQEIELTDEQERCLNYHDESRTQMIKGYAGAGKSLVLQQLAICFLNRYPENDRENKVAIVTYTNTLVENTRQILDKNGGDRIVTSTLNKFLMDVYYAMGGPYRKMYDGKLRQDNIKAALEKHEKETKNHHRFHDLPVEFWEEEIDWMKRKNVSADDIEYYLKLPRKGRGSAVRMLASDRVVAFQMFSTYCKLNDQMNRGDWADFAIYINKKLKEYEEEKRQGKNPPYPIPDKCRVDYLLIDEAQDFPMSQMLAAMGIYRKAMVIAMDANQRIYAANWTTKELGIEAKTDWLRKSMRTTIQIDDLAESLRRRNDEALGADEIQKRAKPEREGAKPVICQLKDSAEEKTFVVSQIKAWMSKAQTTIGVIAATNAQIDKYSAWCADAGISHEIVKKDSPFSMVTPGVKIVTAFSAKGLEFFRVIIPEFTEGNFPYKIKTDDPDEQIIQLTKFRSLAYVAMTRAQESLIITFSGKNQSRFIGEMDKNFYELRKSKTIDASLDSKPNADTNQRDETPVADEEPEEYDSLIDFFTAKGFKCIDKREYGGCLWVLGSKDELAPAIREAKLLFGNLGNNNFAPKGGRATNNQPAWFLTSKM